MTQVLGLLLLVVIICIRYLINLESERRAHRREAEDGEADLELLEQLQPLRFVLRYQPYRPLLEVVEKQVGSALS